ncbi:MAG: heat-inducible transcriptional repressor HrcA [Alphaproteobacteria bacterium]|nr:MAG: heat-inducible transcriptional repressor HrcA [Alphaproteobacteria bacterium]
MTIEDLSERSRTIFRHIVETYLERGEPVGSRTVSRLPGVELSPASVRNVMADLEELGLVYSPHTSAGRVPTEMGLRLFVDALMEIRDLPEEERREIEAHCAASGRRREDVLEEASRLVSGLSHCAGLVTAPKAESIVRHVEFVPLSGNRALAVIVAEGGQVENRIIDLPPGLPASTLVQAANYLNARFQGRTLAQAVEAVRRELDDVRAELDALAARVVEEGVAVWAGSDEELPALIVHGHGHLLENVHAMEDLERIRRLFEDLETKSELVRLLESAQAGEGVKIFIGSENELFSLSGSSLVVAPYRDAEHRVVGVVGVIGPTRINYARIIPVVDYTAQMMSRLV